MLLLLTSQLHTITTRLLGRLRGEEAGATIVEYGLLVSLIGIAIAVTLTALAGDLKVLFDNVCNELTGAATC